MKNSVLLVALLALFSCKNKESEDISIQVPQGFKVTKLFSPSDNGMGSWVSLATDNKGGIIASDQYGKLFQFALPVDGHALQESEIIPLDLDIGFAQGMVWAYNSLFVMVNLYPDEENTVTSGLYRISDSDNDGILDSSEQLFKLDGAGEHGPHGIVLGPDGMLYFMAGNHTLIPDSARYIMPDNWGEDNILPVIKDPRGHANEIKAPGGWMARTDSIGSFIEVMNVGFRNSYDLAFNEEGDFFTFDSDMEWDIGTPWYRPIRVCYLLPGADFGWRTGSGKFPEYYPDNLPGILNLSQGSPTGILYGASLNFPENYRQGIFAMDWSFGTIYFIDLTKKKDTYEAEFVEFLTGESLPVTDMISLEGRMYFTTGGRRLNSGLYRVEYTGEVESEVIDYAVIKKVHEKDSSIELVWNSLGSSSRIERYKARNELESLDPDVWIGKIVGEDNPDMKIQSIIALARLSPPMNSDVILKWLSSLEFKNLTEEQKLDFIRAWQLVLIRYGGSEAQNRATSDYFADFLPSGNTDIDRELMKLLCSVNDPSVVEKSIPLINSIGDAAKATPLLKEESLERSRQYGEIISLMRRNSPETKLMAYLESLSIAKTGWTEESRKIYFSAFQDIFTSTGGWSYKGFAEKILNRALENVPPMETEKWRETAGVALASLQEERLADLPKPKGPGKAWTFDEIENILSTIENGDLENGKVMFNAALCSSCHVVENEGYPIGPDLSTLANRFSLKDILSSIMYPDSSITDQYIQTRLLLVDSTSLTGRILEQYNDTLIVSINPFNLEMKRTIALSKVIDRAPGKRSSMPPGLLNRLNEEEIRDLFFYLSSRKN